MGTCWLCLNRTHQSRMAGAEGRGAAPLTLVGSTGRCGWKTGCVVQQNTGWKWWGLLAQSVWPGIFMSELNGWGVDLGSWIISFDFSPLITEERSYTLCHIRSWHLHTRCLLKPSPCHPVLKHTLTGERKRMRKRKSRELLVLFLFLTSVGVFSYPRYRDKEPPAFYFP